MGKVLINLETELIKKGLDPIEALKKSLKCSYKTVEKKLRISGEFSVSQAVKIYNDYFSDEFTMDYLFQKKK